MFVNEIPTFIAAYRRLVNIILTLDDLLFRHMIKIPTAVNRFQMLNKEFLILIAVFQRLVK